MDFRAMPPNFAMVKDLLEVYRLCREEGEKEEMRFCVVCVVGMWYTKKCKQMSEHLEVLILFPPRQGGDAITTPLRDSHGHDDRSPACKFTEKSQNVSLHPLLISPHPINFERLRDHGAFGTLKASFYGGRQRQNLCIPWFIVSSATLCDDRGRQQRTLTC